MLCYITELGLAAAILLLLSVSWQLSNLQIDAKSVKYVNKPNKYINGCYIDRLSVCAVRTVSKYCFHFY